MLCIPTLRESALLASRKMMTSYHPPTTWWLAQYNGRACPKICAGDQVCLPQCRTVIHPAHKVLVETFINLASTDLSTANKKARSRLAIPSSPSSFPLPLLQAESVQISIQRGLESLWLIEGHHQLIPAGTESSRTLCPGEHTTCIHFYRFGKSAAIVCFNQWCRSADGRLNAATRCCGCQIFWTSLPIRSSVRL
jgi:hypothetical protein